MSRRKISLMFYIRRNRLLKNGEAAIMVRITVERQHTEMSVYRSIKPELWSFVKSCNLNKSKEITETIKYIEYVRRLFNDYVVEMHEKDKDITAIGLRNAYLGINTDDKTIVPIFKDHNESVKKLIGKDFAKATSQRYETCLLHLKNYIKQKYNEEDIFLKKINPDFISGFELYLKTTRNCNHNTTVKYIRNFKKIIRICFLNGWITKDPFASIKHSLKKVDKDFLTEEELFKIMNKKFTIERLEFVRDVFLFGCFTGLAYSDLFKLTSKNLVKDEEDKMWIHTRRTKTGTICHVPLLPIALLILDKYKSNPKCAILDKLLPVYSNQKINAYLKEIGDLCEINKNLSSHMGRHTFATTVTLNNDVPIESVSKMLGHSSIRMTQVYARLLDKKVGKDMGQIYNKYSI
ncbi:MAG: site-specific integrase [Bacteroidia bacterium]|nr:site-specific integrase [Bacteroidia bacterium]